MEENRVFKVEVTYKGKPLDAKEFANDLQKAVIESTVDHYRQKIISVLTPEEIGQVSLDVSTTDEGNLSIKVVGPQELQAKINEALDSE